MITLKTWWQARSSREQRLLQGTAIILAIAMAYYGIWTPLTDAVNHNKDTVTAQTALLTMMTHANQTIIARNRAGFHHTPTPPNLLLPMIEQSLQKASLSQSLKKIEQNGKTIQLTLTQVPFDTVTAWLKTLWLHNGISVTQASVKRDETAGLVDFTMTLHTMH